MGLEYISIVVGGMRYSAFRSVTVRASFDEAVRTFSFIVAAELGASATNAIFSKGVSVEIYANSDLLLTGHVERRQPSLSATEAQITVSGVSSSADLVDGSAEHKTGSFKKKDPKEIGDEVSKKYKPKFKTDQKLEKIDKHQLTQGESVYRCVEKLCRDQGMTLTGTADGNINITKAGKKRQAGGLIEGQNILKGTSDHNEANQHSEYTLRGQRPFGHGIDNLEIESIAREAGVKRHKPIIIVEDADTTKDKAKKRVKNRKDRAAGNALKATITTQGFRDQAGAIWEPGNLVWTESPFLDIAQDMLIESVDYQQDDGGSICTIGLTDPRSYGGEGGKGNKSGTNWGPSDGGEE